MLLKNRIFEALRVSPFTHKNLLDLEVLFQSIKCSKALDKTKCLHAWAFCFLKCTVMVFFTCVDLYAQ
jgi:hypothetical protein